MNASGTRTLPKRFGKLLDLATVFDEIEVEQFAIFPGSIPEKCLPQVTAKIQDVLWP